MSAPAYQPVPTAAQQRELERWVQRKYPARQYRDNADSAIADFQAARLRYEERQPEPRQFCAVEDEATPAISEDFVISVLGVGVLALLAIFFAWGVPA